MDGEKELQHRRYVEIKRKLEDVEKRVSSLVIMRKPAWYIQPITTHVYGQFSLHNLNSKCCPFVRSLQNKCKKLAYIYYNQCFLRRNLCCLNKKTTKKQYFVFLLSNCLLVLKDFGCYLITTDAYYQIRMDMIN